MPGWVVAGVAVLSLRGDSPRAGAAPDDLSGAPRSPPALAADDLAGRDEPGEPRGQAIGRETEGDTRRTQVQMRNVDFRVGEGVVLHIHHLRGTMRSHDQGPLVFDDPTSFTIRIASAEVGMTSADLTRLLARHVFAYPGAPLKNLELRIANGQVVQSGKLHKGVWLPFTIRATVGVTPDGRIRMHPEHTKVLGLNGGAIMKAFGFHLGTLLDLRGSRGAVVDRDDILIDPARALPPPAVQGHLVGIRIEGDQMIQTFGAGRDSLPALPVPDPRARNYMFYRGGSLRFGKLVMLDAEMQIVDLDPRDPFAFDLSRYLDQLVPGYSKTLPDLGLEVFMKDIDDVPASRGARPVASRSGIR